MKPVVIPGRVGKEMAEAAGMESNDAAFAKLVDRVESALTWAAWARDKRTPAETADKFARFAAATWSFEDALTDLDEEHCAALSEDAGSFIFEDESALPHDGLPEELRTLAERAEVLRDAYAKKERMRRPSEDARDEAIVKIAKAFRAAYSGERRDRDDNEEEFVRLALKVARLPLPKTQKELRRLIDEALVGGRSA